MPFSEEKLICMVLGLYFSTLAWIAIAWIAILEQSSKLAEVYYLPSLQV